MSSFENPCVDFDEMAEAVRVDGVAHTMDGLAIVEFPPEDTTPAVIEARSKLPEYANVHVLGVVSRQELNSEQGPVVDERTRLLAVAVGGSVVTGAFSGNRAETKDPDTAEKYLSRVARRLSVVGQQVGFRLVQPLCTKY